ncbi:MAG: beta-propeller domain-containing protein, partial [Acidimicrobiales bacterium]
TNAVPIGNLRTFNACGELQDYFTSNVVSMIDAGWFTQSPDYYFEDDAIAAETTSVADSGLDSSGSSGQITLSASDDASAGRAVNESGDGSFSRTNNQEEGVDEPDLVKTNGEIMVTVSGQILTVADVSGGKLEKLGEVTLESWSRDLLLVGKRVLVLGEATNFYEDIYYPESEVDYEVDGTVLEDSSGPAVADASDPVFVEPPFDDQWRQRSALTEIDISDPARPVVVQQLVVDGYYLSAREIGGVVRVVTQMSPQNIYPETWDGNTQISQEDAVARLRSNILSTDLDYWLPSYSLVDSRSGDVTAEGQLLQCTDVSRPETFSGYGTLSVLTIDLNNGLTVPSSAIGVVAGGDTVYASTESLYVATGQWWRWDRGFALDAGQQPDEMTTEIHKFDISDPKVTEYVGSGAVQGYLLNQFAMSEYNGDLRVASTSQPNFGWSDGQGSQEVSESQVFVLRMDGDRLNEIGAVGGLGKGETIQSVRFIGERGYVVTFRQTDPLYVVDLSDPTAPSVEGELKINGFSAYLHPLSEDLLLGVGQDATDEGQTTGTQVSIFDVSDPKNPTRVQKYNFGDSYSGAEWDHKAFLYWAADNMLVLPLQTYNWSETAQTEDFFSGAVVLNVDGANEITERGRISQPL